MGSLYEKLWIDEHLHTLPGWQQAAYRSFANLLPVNDDNAYPCIPARRGFLTNQLRFGFVSNPLDQRSTGQLASALSEYGSSSREAGPFTSLVVFFETPAELFQEYGVENYRTLFWSLLNRISDLDPQAWPIDIPTDPAHHQWEFCYQGEPYFVFCATPAHQYRRSRHFPCLLMAFQPRWVLENMNDSSAFGAGIQKLIRKRLADYDETPIHPDLKWYGQEDNREWKQYFLSDDESSPSKCPFHRMKK